MNRQTMGLFINLCVKEQNKKVIKEKVYTEEEKAEIKVKKLCPTAFIKKTFDKYQVRKKFLLFWSKPLVTNKIHYNFIARKKYETKLEAWESAYNLLNTIQNRKEFIKEI